MKTLVIPDLHHRIEWIEAAVADERPDRVVFLGDGPDAPGRAGRGYSAVDRLATFMAHWLGRPDAVWLIGNHEAHYIFSHPDIIGSGYKRWRKRRYDLALGAGWGRRMKFAHWEQGWLLSHAGFRSGLMHPIHGLAPEWLEAYQREVFEQSLHTVTPWISIGDGRSHRRTGALGGVTWLDWASEFEPIAGINQIVGHSWDDEPRWKNTADSTNLCLDTGCRHYALIENGALTVKANAHWSEPADSE